jgi:hypothetical protein
MNTLACEFEFEFCELEEFDEPHPSPIMLSAHSNAKARKFFMAELLQKVCEVSCRGEPSVASQTWKHAHLGNVA